MARHQPVLEEEDNKDPRDIGVYLFILDGCDAFLVKRSNKEKQKYKPRSLSPDFVTKKIHFTMCIFLTEKNWCNVKGIT